MSSPAPLAVYEDFSAGEYGGLGAWRAPKGSFTGLNVTRYIDGSIGPRLSPKALTITGLPSGAVVAMGTGGTGSAERCWFVVGTTVYAFDPTNFSSQAVLTYTGALTTAPAAAYPAPSVTIGTKSYLFNRADGKLWTIDHVAMTVAAGATIIAAGGSSSAGASLVAYRDRLVAATTDDIKVYFSDPIAPTTWDADGYIEVGDLSRGITGLFAQRTHLAIAKGNPVLNGHWWVVTGTLGVDEVLRQVTSGMAPDGQDVGDVDGLGGVRFISTSRSPASFSGSLPTEGRHLSAGSGGMLKSAAFALRRPGDVLHLGVKASESMHALAMIDGTWTRHQFSELAPAAAIDKGIAAVSPGTDLVVVPAKGRAQDGFWTWSAYADNPKASTYGAVLPADTACSFTLPEWWAPDGREVSVRAVQVDFRSFVQGSGNNTWTLSLAPLRLHEGGAGTPQTHAFAEASVGADVNRRRQALFSVEDANGFQLSFSGLRGVAIQKITVLGTARPGQGVA